MTGNYGPGALGPHTSVAPLFNYATAGREPTDPVTGENYLGPCAHNEIADGFLSDHLTMSRTIIEMVIQSTFSGSDKFRQAMRKADLTVVIDVVHTETTEQADWILRHHHNTAELHSLGQTFLQTLST